METKHRNDSSFSENVPEVIRAEDWKVFGGVGQQRGIQALNQPEPGVNII